MANSTFCQGHENKYELEISSAEFPLAKLRCRGVGLGGFQVVPGEVDISLTSLVIGADNRRRRLGISDTWSWVVASH